VILCQSDNPGRHAAEVIDELTDFGGLSGITGGTELTQVRNKTKLFNIYKQL